MLRIIPDIVAGVDIDSEELDAGVDIDSEELDSEDECGDIRIDDDEEAINAHFDAIDAKLTMYEKLVNEATLFQDQLGLAEGIVETILSFLYVMVKRVQ
jgi:hypothetical protein